MPFKLIAFLLVMLIAIFFIGFNLDNRCNVSVILHTFEDVPIVLSLLAAYVLGSFSVIPFLLGRRRKKIREDNKSLKKKEQKKKKSDVKDDEAKNAPGTV